MQTSSVVHLAACEQMFDVVQQTIRRTRNFGVLRALYKQHTTWQAVCKTRTNVDYYLHYSSVMVV